MQFNLSLMLCGRISLWSSFLRTEIKNLVNTVVSGNGKLSTQTKRVSKVNNAILEWWNGLDLKILERESETFMQTQL